MPLSDTVEASELATPPPPKPSNTARTILIVVAGLIAVLLLVAILASVIVFGLRSTNDTNDLDTSAPSTSISTVEPAAVVAESTSTTTEATTTTTEATGSTAASSTAVDTTVAASVPPVVDVDENVDGATCSAAEMDPPRGQPELPDAVLATRSRIITAARTCDYEALAELVPAEFLASFGGGDAIELWKEQEAQGQRPLANMVAVLSLPHAVVVTDDGPDDAFGPRTFHVWPTAATYGAWEDVPVADRWALLELYTEADLADFADFGAYVGYRISIAETGEWQYFVNGD